MNGLWVIDKPTRLTSRDAVNRAWRWLPRGTRIGHTGTLDPLASGVLVVCVGSATRLAEYVQAMDKEYRAALCLGARSSTDDGEGALTPQAVAAPPSPEVVAAALAAFVGRIEQIPPAHSAAKVSGRRAYALARQGKAPNLAARPVSVHSLTVLDYRYPRLELAIRCGKGTYIRSLARDLGERLGCGAYLESLERTRVGHFTIGAALSLEATQEAAWARLLPPREAVRNLPSVTLPDAEIALLEAGQGVRIGGDLPAGAEVAVLDSAGSLVAVGQADGERGLLLPVKVFPLGRR